MTLIEASKYAECFGIQAKRQNPTLPFLYYMLQTLDERALIISGFEKKYFSKITTARNIQGIEKYISVINLRTDWKEKKQKYSYEFIYKELELIISKSELPIVVLHSIGDFFEFQDGNEVEAFVDTIVQICTKLNKRLIYTIDVDQELSSVITKAFHHHIDLEVSMEQEDAKHTLVYVNYSIESVRYGSYRFFMPQADSFVFEPIESDKQQSMDNSLEKFLPRVILTGDNEHNLERLKYLFNKEIFDVEVVTHSMPAILGKLMSNPQLLIYTTKDSFHDETSYELCNSAKEQDLQTSIIYIAGTSFIRNSDKRLAGANSCADLFEENFNIEVFVTSIEKILSKPFYTDALQNLKKPEPLIGFDEFVSYRQECLDSHIFFTQLKYRYKKGSFSSKSIMSVLSRIGDTASIVESENIIVLLLLNISVAQVDIFTQKMKKFDSNINFIEGIESVSFHE
jgi:CheY-like chemotaxis protein